MELHYLSVYTSVTETQRKMNALYLYSNLILNSVKIHFQRQNNIFYPCKKPETSKQSLHGKVSLSRVKAVNSHSPSPDEIIHYKNIVSKKVSC